MAISAKHFIDTLAASGVIDPQASAALQEELGAVDSETIARQLVQRQVITEYQAAAVLEGDEGLLQIGEYTILALIGEGGMGRVFKARHRRLDRLAAIKVISRNALLGHDSIARFHQEARTAAQITHSNIVITYDAGEQDGVHYLVMEYVDGQDLGVIPQDRGPLPLRQAVDVMIQTANGLDYAHRRSVIHRDIKPDNLLIDGDGNIKILDMGLARIASHGRPLASTVDRRLTSPGQVIGTLAYMAPEQAESSRQADARSDIYSLGCTFFHLMTGNVPYPGGSIHRVIMSHREDEIPSMRDHRIETPIWLDEVFKKCVRKQPCDRFQSAGELLQVLRGQQAAWMTGAASVPAEMAVPAEMDRATLAELVPEATPAPVLSDEAKPAFDPARMERTSSPRRPNTNAQPARFMSPGPALEHDGGRCTATGTRRPRGKRLVLLGALGLWLSPGVLGLVCGMITAALAAKDLKSIREAKMKSSGKSATTLGMILGGVAALTSVIGAVTGFFG